MANKYVLDAHAVIWYLESNPALGHSARQVLDDPAAELILPIIALAEAIYVVEKGRTSLPSSDHLLLEVLSDPRIAVCPLTLDILQLSRGIPAAVPEMHDRLIAATALWLTQAGHAAALVTKDQTLVQSGVVPVVWD